MRDSYRVWMLAAAMAVVGGGCKNTARDNLGRSLSIEEARPNVEPYLTYMADNAAMHDMSIADIHFVPHTTELSSTGIYRLDRLSAVLKSYGGMVRYETRMIDEQVVANRLRHVHEYIAATGCDMQRVEVVATISGGRGMTAADAIRILHEGTRNDHADGGATSASSSGMSSQ